MPEQPQERNGLQRCTNTRPALSNSTPFLMEYGVIKISKTLVLREKPGQEQRIALGQWTEGIDCISP